MGSFYLSAETWTLLVAFVTLLILYAYWPYRAFKNLGVSGPKPIPFFGTMLHYRKGFFNFDENCYKKYGKIWGIYDGRQPVLCIADPAMIKSILIKECYSLFTNRRNFRLNGPLYDAVSIAEDDQWRRIRSVLSPSFTSGRLKEMFDIMKQHSANLTSSMKKMADKDEPLELKEFFGPYSMDVVTSTAFSVDIDSLNNPSDPFVTNIKKMLKFDLFNPLFLAIGNGRVDFLQLMIDSQKHNDPTGVYSNLNISLIPTGLNDHEILSQSMIFIFAGYETSSSSLTFLAHSLATNPEVMKKLQEEIDATFPNKAPIEYQALMEMEYLDCVINESLRIYPIAPRLERVAKASVEINGLLIPKDMVVLVPTWPIHRDPELWPEPEKFKPERFSKANKEKIDPYTYMPFGAGPRNCIGMRFALVMMKLAIVEILQRYSFSVCKETEIPIEMDIQGLLMPKRPIKLKNKIIHPYFVCDAYISSLYKNLMSVFLLFFF
uniref:unspecific monooxygenase n=1 Tax=Nothobranchius furzeri TaxID=105023 RepID=A0A8C6NQC7_NOTFU